MVKDPIIFKVEFTNILLIRDTTDVDAFNTYKFHRQFTFVLHNRDI